MRNTPNHNTGQNPLDSYAKTLFEQHPPESKFGIAIRRGDARLRLQEMLKAEESVKNQERINTRITDHLSHMQAEHQLNMQYLMQFGVRADERMQFQEILEQVSEHGALSLREAAKLAHLTIQANGSDESGDVSSSFSDSSVSTE